MNQLHIVITALSFLLASAENECEGSYHSTTLVCRSLILEADKPVQISKKIYNSDTGEDCTTESCLNYAFPILNIWWANGSIGPKTFTMIPDIQMLWISHSNFTKIENGALCSLPKLLHLQLRQNEVFPVLNESLLSNCGNLKSIIVERMEIEPSAFKSMSSLENLILDEQTIKHLTSEYFEPLTNLQSLTFKNCKVEEVDPNAICLSSKLEKLSIFDNLLPPLTKAMFENCNQVNVLQILATPGQVTEEGAFSGFTNVKIVRTIGLKIPHLKKGHLAGLNNVELLGLAGSEITTIDADAFVNLEHLKKLSLRANNLTELNSDLFASLPNLFEVHLLYNNIVSIDNIHHPKLEALWASHNAIFEVNAEALKKHFPSLKDFGINCNKLSAEAEDLLEQKLSDRIVVSVAGSSNC